MVMKKTVFSRALGNRLSLLLPLMIAIPQALFCGLQSAAKAVAADVADAAVLRHNLRLLSYIAAPLLLVLCVIFLRDTVAHTLSAHRSVLGGQKALGATAAQLERRCTGRLFLCIIVGLLGGWLFGVLGIQSIVLLTVKVVAASRILPLQVAWLPVLLCTLLCMILLTAIAVLSCRRTVKASALTLLHSDNDAPDKKKSAIVAAVTVTVAAAAVLFLLSTVAAGEHTAVQAAAWTAVLLTAAVAGAALLLRFDRMIADDAARIQAMYIHGYTAKQIKSQLFRAQFVPSLIGLTAGCVLGALLSLLFSPMTAGATHFAPQAHWIAWLLGLLTALLLVIVTDIAALRRVDKILSAEKR